MGDWIFEFIFRAYRAVLDYAFKIDNPQLEELDPNQIVTDLEKAVTDAGLYYTKTTVSSGRHVVRATLGPQQLTFSFGSVKKGFFSRKNDEYTLECVAPLNPRTHSFPLFSITSDLAGDCSLINKGSVDELIFTPNDNRIAYDLSLNFAFYGAPDMDPLNLLTPEVSIKLRQLKGLFGNDGLVILSENQEVRVSKQMWRNTGMEEFILFVPLALELVSALLQCVGPSLSPHRIEGAATPSITPSVTSSALYSSHENYNRAIAQNYSTSKNKEMLPACSIELLDCSTFSDDDKYCQICGDLIGEEYVICTACNVPHHEDCWHYNGQCSTFGCMCTTFKEK